MRRSHLNEILQIKPNLIKAMCYCTFLSGTGEGVEGEELWTVEIWRYAWRYGRTGGEVMRCVRAEVGVRTD